MSATKKSQKNVEGIVNNALCSACGACAGICPVNAVNMSMQVNGFVMANVDDNICIKCGKCVEICPSNGMRRDTDLVGETICGYIGYATAKSVRKNGQSGGVVTAILQYLFESNAIDGAVITKFNIETKSAESFMAQNSADVMSASGSYYTQTSPVEMILKNQDKRLAAVLLGCQAASLYQIKQKYPSIKLPLFTIGLICGGNNSRLIVDDLLELGGYDGKEKLHSFLFRDKANTGWPGDITFKTKKLHLVPKEKRMELKPHYQNYRCLVCADKMNLHCDLVVGDPWGISIDCEEEGYSAIITRTENGEKLLRGTIEARKIEMREWAVGSIIEGQRIQSELEKRHNTIKIIARQNKWEMPYNDCETQEEITDVRYRKDITRKMEYARKLYLCKNKQAVFKLIAKNKRELSGGIKETLYKIKKAIFK